MALRVLRSQLDPVLLNVPLQILGGPSVVLLYSHLLVRKSDHGVSTHFVEIVLDLVADKTSWHRFKQLFVPLNKFANLSLFNVHHLFHLLRLNFFQNFKVFCLSSLYLKNITHSFCLFSHWRLLF